MESIKIYKSPMAILLQRKHVAAQSRMDKLYADIFMHAGRMPLPQSCTLLLIIFEDYTNERQKKRCKKNCLGRDGDRNFKKR